MGRMNMMRTLVLALSTWGIALLGACGAMTNDVDRVLDEKLFVGPASYQYSLALSRLRLAIESDKSVDDVGVLKRRIFQKVVGLPVSTNMVAPASHLRAKEDMISDLSRWVCGALKEEDALSFLAMCAHVEVVGTNDLSAAYALAVEKDRALGWDEKRGGYSGHLPPNFRVWREEMKGRLKWNSAVTGFRKRMTDVAVQILDDIWKDEEEGNRKKKIRRAVESSGLTMPGDAGVVSDDDFTVSLEN